MVGLPNVSSSVLLYMDDLNLYGRNPDQLDGLLHTVRTFSDDIRMKFGLDKCAIAHFVNGKLSGHNTGVKVGKTETIKGLEPGQVYKYLGVDESNGIQHSTMRERLRREYFRRVKMVLRTELYGRNKVLAINGLALPVLTYSFGVIHWRTTDLQQLDRRTRKLLTMHGVHNPSADVDRLYAPCNEGGRGLQQIEAINKSCIVGLECYLNDSSYPYMQLVYECDSGRSRYSIKSMACRFAAQLRRDLAKDDTSQSLHGSGTVTSDCVFEQAPQMDAKHFRMCNSSLRVRLWSRKPMHGQYRRLTEQSPVDTKETFGWLKAANLPGATEGLVVAAQDQALRIFFDSQASDLRSIGSLLTKEGFAEFTEPSLDPPLGTPTHWETWLATFFCDVLEWDQVVRRVQNSGPSPAPRAVNMNAAERLSFLGQVAQHVRGGFDHAY